MENKKRSIVVVGVVKIRMEAMEERRCAEKVEVDWGLVDVGID
jgi:hypothetical protein